MKLSTYFSNNDLHIDSVFNELGYADSSGKNILTFCDNLNYLNIALRNQHIDAIIIKEDLLPHIKKTKKGIVTSINPRNSFFDIYNHFRTNNLFLHPQKYTICKSAEISSTAIVSKRSSIGNNTVISDNVIIKDNVFIGDNCFIDAGTILGNDGILYMKKNNNNIFIRHAGSVMVGNNVTISSNATIVKSVFPNMPTVIDDYSIVGISSTIGHEARIGKNCRILGNCVIAKNTSIDESTIVGSSSVVRENLKIGSNVDIKAGSIVVKDLKDNESVSGNFAIEHNKNIKNYFKNQK